eukprot:PITA_32545
MCLEETTRAEDEFIDLKSNFLPTGLTPLEDMFDDNDVPKKPKMEPLNAVIEEHNIGTTEQPKMIKLSKNLPPDQKPKYVDLFKEFQDVFAWSYEDLKSYDTLVIQHTIPLKPNKKPFKQKLRRINPMLLSLIEKEIKRMFEAGNMAFSLNPKKSLFSLEEGKLLGHIISKDGIRIDPERIQAILQIPYPRNIKELQAFLGKINFLRRFIPNLAELMRLLSNMLKKYAKVRWSLETKKAFESIKTALTQTPVLTSPQFDKDFIIFSFASKHTIAAVLLQKDDQGNEKPIAFFSRALRDAPLKYQIMEK